MFLYPVVQFRMATATESKQVATGYIVKVSVVLVMSVEMLFASAGLTLRITSQLFESQVSPML